MATDVPEIEEVTTSRVHCDGKGGALGHPRVYMQIGPRGYVDCGYCDKRFVLKDGAEEADH
ncbi:MAG: zinc-finger domain-containing protein [Pseudomonadota bacterium]